MLLTHTSLGDSLIKLCGFGSFIGFWLCQKSGGAISKPNKNMKPKHRTNSHTHQRAMQTELMGKLKLANEWAYEMIPGSALDRLEIHWQSNPLLTEAGVPLTGAYHGLVGRNAPEAKFVDGQSYYLTGDRLFVFDPRFVFLTGVDELAYAFVALYAGAMAVINKPHSQDPAIEVGQITLILNQWEEQIRTTPQHFSQTMNEIGDPSCLATPNMNVWRN